MKNRVFEEGSPPSNGGLRAVVGMICGVPTRVTTDARRAALDGLFDHAALFPPASMPVPEALSEDERVRDGDESFLVGRFVVPASRLAALEGFDRALSVVLDGDLPDDDRVEAVEARLPPEPPRLVGLAPEIYVEVPLDGELALRVAELHELGLRLKVRCGGESVPPGDELARFVRTCRETGAVFKATAGLHHPVRSGGEHGFLNLLAAAVFSDEEAALAEDDPDAFLLTAASFAWRGREADAGALARVRRELLHSIGSCSIREPVDHLTALGVLPL
jgi:hypothetical protein